MDKELLPVAWHPTRMWDWYMSKDEKKECMYVCMYVFHC